MKCEGLVTLAGLRMGVKYNLPHGCHVNLVKKSGKKAIHTHWRILEGKHTRSTIILVKCFLMLMVKELITQKYAILWEVITWDEAVLNRI